MTPQENLDESRALELSRKCVASRLPNGVTPRDDDDLVKTGLLDSMGWVDVLIGVESATGLRDFGNSSPESKPKSIQSLAEMICEAQEKLPEESTKEGIMAGAHHRSEVSISGWGYALGSVTVDADQIEQELYLDPHKIRDGAGILALRLAASTEDELILGQRAAEIALEMAGVGIEGIDFLVATSTTFLNLPSFAASLHSRLLLGEGSGALDVGGACAGLIYSLAVAQALLCTTPQGLALVVAADVNSRRLSASEAPEEFRGLFGDGACAFVLTRSAKSSPMGSIKLRDFVSGCSGTYASALRVNVDENSDMTIQFKGELLAHAAITQMNRTLEVLEKKCGQPRSEVDYFALHQPNPRVIGILAERANVPLEKIPLISKTCGNLGAATCGIGLCQALTNLRTRQDPSGAPLIFMAAVAPGLIWAGTFFN